MNEKHTPGPWRTGEPFAAFDGGTVRFHISQADGAPYTPDYSDVAQLVAETTPGEKLEIQRANAHLIAAAPDMFAALCDVVAVMERDLAGLAVISPELAAARAAIAKATGSAS
jgi:hypothetical protein